MFVNKIVKIVHECGKKWDGIPSNNFGDKYVLTWRLPTEEDAKKDSARMIEGGDEGGPIQMAESIKSARPDAPWAKDELDEFEDIRETEVPKLRTEISDKALISAVKAIAELSRAQDLQAYSRHPKILPKFGQNYKTQISFGIHVGFAIEGSIGTDMKVDAIQLSPDAQIAMRIESLNEKYGTQILLTGDFYDLLSERGQASARQIDTILINESVKGPK